jgi:hypothetical protein
VARIEKRKRDHQQIMQRPGELVVEDGESNEECESGGARALGHGDQEI